MDLRRRADALFDAALDLAPAERAPFVADRCGEDRELREQVSALLAAHERAEGILELDARQLAGGMPAPDRLGAYRLGRPIGEGGMGVVYEAERDDGQFLRRVAIKLLRSGQDTDLHRRVLAERQILAALDHPNVARLLDGGVSADGRPYLVMERIDGLPVDVYCDRMRLTVAERLRLFTVIARAVAYAHRNLIVHRDLKPSNILVTAEGVVKLLDFGVAKLLNPGLGGAAAHTLPDRLAFTPEYASPEQLRGDALTTQADIFALGVLLYELLAGRRPFAAAGLGPLVREITESEPERPSARVLRAESVPALDGASRVVEPTAVARARQTTPARLQRALRGDLDAIIAMALCKEARGRYDSAELLADDIERHLTAQPVRARRRGQAYMLAKFVRRHRLSVAAIAVGACSLVAGASGALWQARAASAARDRAQAAAAQSEQVTSFMIDLFEAGVPGASGTGVIAASDLVHRGVARIEELAGQPVVQARMLATLSSVHEALGEYEQSQRLLQRALAVRTAAEPTDENELARLLVQLGIVQRRRSVYDSAEASFQQARALLDRAESPSDTLLGRVLQQLTSIAIYQGDLLEAERRIEEAVGRQERELGVAHSATLVNLRQLAAVQSRRGDPRAEQTLRRVIEARPRTPDSRPVDAMMDELSLAEVLVADDRSLEEAEAIYRRAVASMRTDDPAERGAAVWAREGLAGRLAERGDLAGAEQLRREVVELNLETFGAEHPNTAFSQGALAGLLLQAGRVAEAERLYREAGAVLERVFGRTHTVYSGLLLNEAALAEARGRHLAADSLIAAAMEIRARRNGRASGPYVEALQLRARVQARLGDFERARAMLLEALSLTRSQVLPGGRQLRALHAELAGLYQEWGRPAEAARHRQLAHPPDAGPPVTPASRGAVR